MAVEYLINIKEKRILLGQRLERLIQQERETARQRRMY